MTTTELCKSVYVTGVDVLDVYYEEGEVEGRRQASREMTSLARDYL